MAEEKREWPDLAGRIDGERHILPVRVYHEDTDFSGFVYHANYLRWIERGRSDYLRLLGIRHGELKDQGNDKASAFFVVRRMELDYLKPARMDEALEVVTSCAETGAAWLTLDQRVIRDNQCLFTARVQVVLISQAGKPLRLSEHIRTAFSNADFSKN